MPDPDFNPNAKVMAIDAIQKACSTIGARLVFLPDMATPDDTPAQFELPNGRALRVPVKQLMTDRPREQAIADLVELLRGKKKAETPAT